MSEIFVDFSSKCPVALATIIKLINAAGCDVKKILAMPSDRAAIDGSTFEEQIRREKGAEIPAGLVESLVALNATLTLSHDVGVGHFRANDESKVVFGLKHFLDHGCYSYVITHDDTGAIICDNSGVTLFD